jgi:predicted permease
MPSIRDILRSLRRSPGLALAAATCIAVGSASTTAVSTLADVALLRALPFPDAERLTRIWLDEKGVDSRQWLSIPEAQEIEAAATSFDAVLITARVRAVVLFGNGAERLRGEGVNSGYFQTLGLRPVLGRFFEAADHATGAPRVIVLSHGTWMRGFGGDSGVIGRAIRSERAVYTIIGVAPRGFTGTVEDDLVEFWIPVEQYEPASIVADRTVRATWTIGRLRPGASIAAAQGELDSLLASWAAAHPDSYRKRRLRIEPFGENWRGGYRRGLGVLTAAATGLLAIAAINVGCLLLARVLDRGRELTIRAALGAGRGRIAIQLFIEALVIVGAGGVAGVLLGPYMLDAFLAASPIAIPRYLDVQPDLRTLVASMAALTVAGVITGTVPAFAGGRVAPGDILKETARGTVGQVHERRWIGVLIAAETSLTLTLLVCGALLVRSHDRLDRIDLGHRRDGIARLAVTLSRADAGEPETRHQLFRRLRHSIETYPGVERAGLVALTLPPWDADRARIHFPMLDPEIMINGLETGVHMADDGLFAALGVRLVEGRNFAESDGPGGAPVAIVSASLASRFGGPQRALGQEITFAATAHQSPTTPAGTFRIVGVVGDVAYDGVAEQDTRRYIDYGAGDPKGARLDVYLPLARFPMMTVSIAAMTSGDAKALLDPLRRRIAEVAPSSAVHWTSTMADEVALEYAPTRFYALLVGTFSCSALVLTSVGLFALLSHAASRRAAEMAVRLALGATPRAVAMLLLRGGFVPVLAGAALGLGSALWTAAAMRGLLYDVGSFDAVAFGVAVVTLCLVTLAAGVIPARRVATVDPVAAIKGEG